MAGAAGIAQGAAQPTESEQCEAPDAPSELPADAEKRAPHALAARDDGRTIDVLVVYTALARQDYRRMQRDLDTAITRSAADANRAFANSGIDLRVNVVHQA